jgi:outer membrane protein assembly factor BamA
MKRLIITLSILSIIYAQSNQEFVLKDVKVEGNIVSTANTIIFTSGLRQGLTVSSAEFPRAIKRLWQLGLFDDVQIKYHNCSVRIKYCWRSCIYG